MKKFYSLIYLIFIMMSFFSCKTGSHIFKKRYFFGYTILKNNNGKNSLTHHIIKTQFNKNADSTLGAFYAINSNNKYSYQNIENQPNNLSFIIKNQKNKIENYSINKKNLQIEKVELIHKIKTGYATKKNINKLQKNLTYSLKSNKMIPIGFESGNYFYFWGGFISLFIILTMLILYSLIYAGILIVIFDPKIFSVILFAFIIALIVFGILILINID
ncbi:MAG: hypothetical protein N3F09_08860 [Bacteroidia bacterium]|nr:hypothetical protein [Bacteroidia bacterium]